MTFEDKETDPSVKQLGLLNFIGEEDRGNDDSSVYSERNRSDIAAYNLFSDKDEDLSPPHRKAGILKKFKRSKTLKKDHLKNLELKKLPRSSTILRKSQIQKLSDQHQYQQDEPIGK